VAKFISLLASGIALGAVIALVGLGLILLFRATGIINFAHGILVTLGAYIAVWGIETVGLGTIPADLLALFLMLFVGVALERVAYAPLRKRPQMVVVISTLAASTVIGAAISLWRGSQPEELPSPVGNSVIHIGGAVISDQRLVVIGVVAVAVVASMLVLKRTAIGRQVRSLACDREAAQLCGARVRFIAIGAFAVSAFFACLAGILIAPLTTVNLTFGFDLMLSAFAAAVLGGFGSLGGVVIGALIVGLVQQLVGGYIFTNYASTLPFILMLIVIAVRPSGILKASAQRL
jgi:branched-chain amino acid transport system permease protein